MSSKEYNKTYYEKNKERLNKKSKEYYENNKSSWEHYTRNNKTYYENNKDKWKEYDSKWKTTNPERYKENIKNWQQTKRINDPLYKLKSDVQVGMNRLFRNLKIKKSKRTEEILGCSIENFKQHIESQFEYWMNWENRGSKIVEGPNLSWDIDHIIPLSSAETEEDVRRLNHYTNLRPLCSYQNRFVKRNNIE